MSPWSPESYITAYRFAAHAHQGQTVPGTNIAYIMHLSLVSMEVIAALTVEVDHAADLAVQCALLHDVIEDTEATYEQLLTVFGPAVAAGVLALSKDKALAAQVQLADSLERIKQQPSEIWMVKLADRITNLQRPPAYWSQEKIARYWKEALEIHQVLGAASPLLAQRLLEKAEAFREYVG